MSAATRRVHRVLDRSREDSGQISLLILGMTMVAILLILTTSAITAVSLARMRLLDAADSSALVAANALDAGTYASTGVGEAVPLSDASVTEAAATNLSELTMPSGILSWGLAPGTGTPDGQTAVVVLTGRVRIPFASAITAAAAIDLTVTSRARAGVG